ncbi:hypothetical protein AALA22_15365 [Anaerovoracaceae bacterium 41-7]
MNEKFNLTDFDDIGTEILKMLIDRGVYVYTGPNLILTDAGYAVLGLIIDKFFHDYRNNKTFSIMCCYSDKKEYMMQDFNIVIDYMSNYYTNLDRLKSLYEVDSDEIVREKAVEAYMKTNYDISFKASVFKTKDNKKIVCIGTDFIGFYGMVYCVMFAPTFFKNDFKGVAAQNKDFIKFISKSNDIDSIIELISIECAYMDFISIKNNKFKKKLRDSINYNHNNRELKLEEDIKNTRECMKHSLDEYNRYLLILNDLNTKIISARDFNEEQFEIFADYILSCDKIHQCVVSKSTLLFNVETFVSNYDEELYKAIVKNNSIVFNKIHDDITQFKLLCDDIFVKRKYKVRCKSAFRLWFDDNSGFEFGETDISNAECRVISPHTKFKCQGTFEPLIIDALGNGDYISALNYCIALASNINWTDATVCSELLYDIYISKCIEDSNGNIYSGSELMKNY